MKENSKVPILVTGGAGYIGSHTCKALAAQGYLPVSFDNLSLGHRWAVKWGPLVVGDLLDTVAIERVLKEYRIQSIVHFAASAYVGDSMRDPAFYYRNNLLTTLSLLDAMRSANARNVIFSSSCAVYGNPVDAEIGEDHPTNPLSPYGQSKLDSENAIRWYARAYGFKWLALRYFNAAGADPDNETGEDHQPETRLIPRAILAAMGREPPLQVFGSEYRTRDGTAVRDYIHVTDLADAHVKGLLFLERGGASGALNLGTGRGYSVLEIIRSIETFCGVPVPHDIVAAREGDPAEVVANPEAAGSTIAWTPRHSALKTIVETAWNWHKRGKSHQ